MADNKKLQDLRDDTKIDLWDRNEVAYVTRRWGFTAGNIAVAMHVTKSVTRAKVIGWLVTNWPKIDPHGAWSRHIPSK